MKNNHLEQLQKETEKKARKKQKRKRPKMLVSGKSVFRLKEMMRKKGHRMSREYP